MKVAVISNPSTHSGKSSFITVLSTVFAKTQNKDVSLFSTEDMSDYLESVTVHDKPEGAQSISVYTAMMRNGQLKGEEYYDYANNIGDGRVYAFNLFGSKLARHEQEELFEKTFKYVDSELELVEVKGDINDPFNMRVIDSCNIVLFIMNTSNEEFKYLKVLKDALTEDTFKRMGIVIQKYDDKVISEKTISKRTGIAIRNMLIMNYCPVVQKLALKGEQDSIADLIISGHPEVANMRVRIQEVMKYLFENIRGISEWHHS